VRHPQSLALKMRSTADEVFWVIDYMNASMAGCCHAPRSVTYSTHGNHLQTGLFNL
jgi:hypothetical protein